MEESSCTFHATIFNKKTISLTDSKIDYLAKSELQTLLSASMVCQLVGL